MAKPKVAFYWCASCGGCEEAVVDLNESILPVAAAIDIVLWPVALDYKRKDVESLGDGEIAVSFINGAVRLSEHVMMVKMLRRKSQLVVAFGACSHLGGIPGLANFWNEDTIFERIYKNAPSVENPDNILPKTEIETKGGKIELPHFFSTVRTLDQTIPVDYYLPGCPPPTDLIQNAVNAILKGELPEKGEVLAPEKSLCDTCPLAEKKPEKISMDEIKRPHEIISDPEKCFLEEGIICLGPATRSGCGETCINANMPCRGCMGPTKKVSDHGARMMTAIASILGIENEDELREEDVMKIIDQIVDPAGTFYRFSLPASILRRKRV